jgi:hypothetical protein
VRGERNGSGPSQADGVEAPKVEDHQDFHRQTGGSEMKLTPVGIGIAKHVFQVHTVDVEIGEKNMFPNSLIIRTFEQMTEHEVEELFLDSSEIGIALEAFKNFYDPEIRNKNRSHFRNK